MDCDKIIARLISSYLFRFLFTSSVDNAASECALDDKTFDETLCNDGDLEKLEKEIQRLLRVIRERINS